MKDWPNHKQECKQLVATREEAKQLRKEVKGSTGKSKTEQKQDWAEMGSMLSSKLDFKTAFRAIAHMVSMGGNLPDIGITKPTKVFFIVNLSAWKVFSQSNNISIQNTVIVTAIPPEHLSGIMGEEPASLIKEQQKKIPCLAGFLWTAIPDRYKGNLAVNGASFMSYRGSQYELQEQGVPPNHPGLLKKLQVNSMKNCAISRNLAANGAPQIPLDLAKLCAGTNNNPPKWEALANSEKFRSIVEQKPFGVFARLTDRTSSTTAAVVDLFVNIECTKVLCAFLEKNMQEELPDSMIEDMMAKRTG
jgi:hypothetical protein